METIIGTSGTYYALNAWLLFCIPCALILLVMGLAMMSDYTTEIGGIFCFILACILILTIIILSTFRADIFEYTEWYEIHIEEPSYANSLEFNKKYIIKEKKTENIYIVEKRE